MPGMSGMDQASLPSPAEIAAFYHDVVVLGLAAALFLGLWLLAAGSDSAPSEVPGSFLLRFGLGGLWLLDGVLQLQGSFINHFAGGVLLPLLQGQPPAIAALVRFGVTLWSVNPVGWNAGAAVLQMAIGVALLAGRSLTSLGLWLSVGWGLVVWVFGEGLGGIFAGGSLFTGAPGSALLYVIAALALLRSKASGAAPSRQLTRLFAGTWALGLVLQLWPPSGYWQPGTFSGYLTAMSAMPQPAFLAQAILGWARILSGHPALWNTALCLLWAVLAAGWALRPRSRWLWGATALAVLGVWVLGEDFGVLGGMGTDPNTGAVLLLFLAVLIHSGEGRAKTLRTTEHLDSGRPFDRPATSLKPTAEPPLLGASADDAPPPSR
jgi:hypothetical protein